MAVGHLAAGLGAAGSITLNWQQQGTYVDKLPQVLGLAARRWSDNKKNKQHFQTLYSISQNFGRLGLGRGAR